jgi:hypothetical protein
LLIALLPFLFAFQCEEDTEIADFATDYVIQNDSGIDLMLLYESNSFVEIDNQSDLTLATDFSSTANPILPSATPSFNVVTLYRRDNGNYILVYVQDPIDDDLWIYSEPIVDRYEFRLTITSDMVQ